MQLTSAARFCIIFPYLLALPLQGLAGADVEPVVLRGDYFGQELPGNIPEPFVPRLFSVWGDQGYHLCSVIVFSPEHDALVFSNQLMPAVPGKGRTLVQMFRKDEGWSAPEIAPFSGDYIEDRAFYSPSGDTLYFSSTRPAGGKGPAKDHDIWLAVRNQNAQSRPDRLDHPINTVYNEHCGALTSNGRMYFSSDRPGGNGGVDVYTAQCIDGSYGQLMNLGNSVNTTADDHVVYVADDETFMIIYRSSGAESERGLYISYRSKHDFWASVRSMGDHLKALNAVDASFSPDGKYLFLLSEGNGIYWLRATIIEYAKSEDLEVSRVLIKTSQDAGMGEALRIYHTMKQKHADFMEIDEYFLNQRGHQLLDAGHPVDAITIFRIAVELFPYSWNAYDSLGEAYVAHGRPELAAYYYERSLELNPQNENAAKMLHYINTHLRN